jgi:hypothetical protein
MAVPLLMAVSAAGQTPPTPSFDAVQYPKASYTTTTRVIHKDKVEISATQVKPTNQEASFFCRAWVTITAGGKVTNTLYFPDIDPVAGSFGLFVPIEQPVPDYLFLMKFGDYDGRLYLVDASGAVTNLKGGWFFLDSSKRYLYSQYASDQPELLVFDLTEKRAIFHSEIPVTAAWFQNGDKYLFLSEDDQSASHENGMVQLKIVDLLGQKISSVNMSEQQIERLPRVKSPVEAEHRKFRDCAF